MRILYCTDATERGGAEEHLRMIAMCAHQRGHEAYVAMPLLETTRELLTEIERAGIIIEPIQILPHHPRINILKNIQTFLNIFKRIQPDIIHFVLPFPTRNWCGMLAAALARQKYVVDFQLVPPHLTLGWKGVLSTQWLLRYIFRHADGLIAVSEGNRRRLERSFSLPSFKVSLIYNSIEDVDHFSSYDAFLVQNLREELRITSQIVLTTIANFYYQKGYDILVNAASMLIAENNNIVFLCVGEGELKEQILNFVREYGISDHFRFLGYRKEVKEILALTDIFVFPTRYEGLPMAVIEAMAAGKPVVASRVDGVEEIVVHNETGILVEPENPEKLADVVESLIKDPAARERMGELGRERAERLFSLETMADKTFNLYNQILKRSENVY